MILQAGVTAFASPIKGMIPWFKDFRAIRPDGALKPGTLVIVVEPGPFFDKCMSPAGVVFFKIENLTEAT